MQMVTFMRVSGETTRLMATDPTLTQMEQPMLVTGSTINNMVVELKPGLMVPSMTANTSKERNMDAEL